MVVGTKNKKYKKKSTKKKNKKSGAQSFGHSYDPPGLFIASLQGSTKLLILLLIQIAFSCLKFWVFFFFFPGELATELI